MSEDNNFTLGDILWEYADYVPPVPTQLPSVPLPPEMPRSAEPPPFSVTSAPPEKPSAPPAPPGPPSPYLPANQVPPANRPLTEAPAEKAAPTEPSPIQPASPVPEAAPAQPPEPMQAPTPVQTEEAAQETAEPPQRMTGLPQDDGPDLIAFTPDPGETPEGSDEADAGDGQDEETSASGEQVPPAQETDPQKRTAPPRRSAQPAEEPIYAPRRERKPRPGPEIPPDATAAQLAEEYSQDLGSRKSRCITASLLSVLLMALSLTESDLIPVFRDLLPGTPLLVTAMALFAVVAGLCWDVLKTGLIQLTNKAPDQNTLALFAAVFAVVDGLLLLIFQIRENSLPFFAPCALVLSFHAMGQYFTQSNRRQACRNASAVAQPYVVTQDPNVQNGQTAFRKWMGPLTGFGSQIRALSEGEFRFRRLTPVLLAACFVLAMLTTVVHKQANLAFWSLSALFCAASTLGASLTLSLPQKLLSKRLDKNGVALAGWPGIMAGKGGKAAVLGDYDLYPPNAVSLQGAQNFGQWSMERATSCAASVIRASGSGLTYLFDKALRAQKGAYLGIERLVMQENGLMGYTTQGQLILVGNGEFMSQQAIALPQGAKGKDALFCAVGGEMAGMFVLKYTMHPAIMPALGILFAHKIHVILAARDYHITPHRLRLRGRIALKQLSFPELQRRVNLSGTKQPHDPTIVAVLCREGLPPYAEAVVSAKRLRRAGILGSWIVNVSACVGVFLTASLSSTGALGAMCAWNLSLFLLLWLVPVVLLALWTRQF